MAYLKQNKLHIVVAEAVIRNKDGKYLVLKRHDREIAFPGLYCLPGGKVEDNESMQEALEKEVMEEASLKLEPGRLLIREVSFVRPDDQTVKCFVYLCEVADLGVVKISEDFTDYKWVSPEEVQSLRHVPGLDVELARAEEIFQSGLDPAPFLIKP